MPQTLSLSFLVPLLAQWPDPDVRIADVELHAASAAVGIAEVARLPNIAMSILFGSAVDSGGGLSLVCSLIASFSC